MKLRFPLIALSIAFLSLGCAHSRSRSVTIVRDGKSDYVIAIPAEPSPAETLAADEVAKYLRQMSGAQLPIQRGGKVPARALLISDDRSSRSIGAQAIGEIWERYVIAIDGERINIGGFRPRSTLY